MPLRGHELLNESKDILDKMSAEEFSSYLTKVECRPAE
jgi:hypothetical protein